MGSPTFKPISGGGGGTTDHSALTNRNAANQHPSTAISVDTTEFDGNLSSADDTVQKALETIDEMSGGGADLPVVDTTSIVKDPADATKQARIDVGSVAAGTIRVITVPNQDVDLTPGQTFPGASSVILKSLATAADQFLLSSSAGTWVVKTIAEIQTKLGLGTAAYTSSSDYATASHNHSGVYQAISSLLTSIAGLNLTGNGGKVISVKSDVSGFELTSPSGGSLDIHSLTGESGIVSGDEIPFYDLTASGNRKITLYQLKTAIGGSYTPWTQIADFTATPASTSTITTSSDLSGTIKAGFPLKYTIGGTEYTGRVLAITSNLITVEGPSLSGDITALYYGDPARVVQLDFLIPGYYEDATNYTLFASDLGQCIPWKQGPAYIVSASVRSRVTDGSSNGTWNLVKAQGHAGTAQAGAATTITLSSRASATDDYYNGMYVAIVSGTGNGQIRAITDYVGSTKVSTVSTWTTNPDSTSEYKILLGDPSSSTGILTSAQTIAYPKEWYSSGVLINSAMYQLTEGSEIELYVGKGTGGDAQDLSGVIVLVMA
jgi:hypothetical protein